MFKSQVIEALQVFYKLTFQQAVAIANKHNSLINEAKEAKYDARITADLLACEEHDFVEIHHLKV